MTIQELFEIVQKKHWNKPRFVKSGWGREVEKYYLKHIAPTFCERECKRISIRNVREWHDGLSETPVTANRCLEVLSRMYSYAEEYEMIPLGHNPCRLVKAFPEAQRGRFASEEELKRIGESLAKQSARNPREVNFIRLLALTGARPRSLMEVRVEQLFRGIDGGGFLVFSGKTTKQTGIPERIELSIHALQVLDVFERQEDGRLIGLVRYRETWERVREEAKCPDLWLRDLRRTFATIGLSSGIGVGFIGELLNHKSSQTTQRYAKLLPTARIQAIATIGNRLEQLMGGMSCLTS